MSHVTIPREPTPSLLRPFIGCNTQELHEAWAAMVRIAEVEYARSGSQCLAQIEEPAQPVLYVSTAQLEEHRDPDFPDHGRYLPARKTPAGMFTQPLYAKADPADVARPAIAALQIIAHWPITGETNMDAANMRAVARKALAAPALEAPAGQVLVPTEVKNLYDFMCAAFAPMTGQQQEIEKSLQLAKAAVARALARSEGIAQEAPAAKPGDLSHALEAPAAPAGEVVYRWQALDFSGYCYGSNPPEDLPARCNLTPFYRQPDAYRAALHEISATGNLTATGQQFARHLQQIACDALAAAPQAPAVPEGWKLVPTQVPDSAYMWVSGGYSVDYRASDPRDQKIIEDRAQHTWLAILEGISPAAAPHAPAQEAPDTPAQHQGMTIAGNGAAELGKLMREQRDSRMGVYPDGNPNSGQP